MSGSGGKHRLWHLHRFVKNVLLDSKALFEHWGARRAAVPGAFGVFINEYTHPVEFYHGAQQTIYGHGSFGLSYVDNHVELAIASIRQALEIRLRRAFGLIGKEAICDGAFHPVPISELLDVMRLHRAAVRMPVPLHNVKRIYHWASMCLHTGFRSYAWTSPRVLDYLRPLLVGGETAPCRYSVDSGIGVTNSSFDAIRKALKLRIESTAQPKAYPQFRAILSNVSQCDVVIEDEPQAPTQ